MLLLFSRLTEDLTEVFTHLERRSFVGSRLVVVLRSNFTYAKMTIAQLFVAFETRMERLKDQSKPNSTCLPSP